MGLMDKNHRYPATSIQPPLVVSVIYDRLWTFEFAMTTVFALDWADLGFRPYRFAVAAAEQGPLGAFGGLTVDSANGLGLAADANLLIVPGWRDPSERPPEPLLDAVRAAADRGARLASLWDGVFVLAHAGVLDDRRATTHWQLTDELRRRFPRVRVSEDVLYKRDDTIFTSAGALAGIDMLLSIIEDDYGAAVANRYAARMISAPRRAGRQKQPTVTRAPTPGRIAKVIGWMSEHYAEPITVATLARHTAMSERTFARKFLAATGETPIAWLTHKRIGAAQEMLETTDAGIERIARECGFGTAELLRHHFRRQVGVSPLEWRRSFRPLR